VGDATAVRRSRAPSCRSSRRREAGRGPRYQAAGRAAPHPSPASAPAPPPPRRHRTRSASPRQNFRAFSAPGRAAPAPRSRAAPTSRIAAPAAAEARGMACWLLPKVSTMNATSVPSRSTPWKASVNRTVRDGALRCEAARCATASFLWEDRLLVVQGGHATGAQHRFAQPLHAEHQQDRADDGRRAFVGIAVSAGPSGSHHDGEEATAATAPYPADLQPRAEPAARTIVWSPRPPPRCRRGTPR